MSRRFRPSSVLVPCALAAGGICGLALLLPLLFPSTPIAPVASAAPGPAAPAAAARAATDRLAGDCARAVERLTEAGAGESPEARRALLLAGLHAHDCERPREAVEPLRAAAGAWPELEDWRLLALAESALAGAGPASGERRGLARAALDRLLAEHPGSPLRPRAFVAAAELAREEEDAERVLALAHAARVGGGPGPGVGPATQTILERLVWEVGEATGLPAARAGAARWLLVHAPETAEELGIDGDALRPAAPGAAPAPAEDAWLDLLTREELLERAGSLAAARRFEEGIETLRRVRPAERDLDWHLLAAELLTRDRQGAEALAILDAARPAGELERVRVAWGRARAAEELARVRRGRRNLPAPERERVRRLALANLQQVAASGADPELAAEALEELFEEAASDRRFEESLAILHRLRELDPEDTTGAEHLWQLGWDAYRGRNYSGAIGFWSELAALYPEDRRARAGRYWSGRAHEMLGNPGRAAGLFGELVASDTADFYSRFAQERLDPPPARTGGLGVSRDPGHPVDPWPTDPRLARAERLAELALDRLALAEVDAVEATAAEPLDRRAAGAVRAVSLARRGEIRESILPIRRAFPALGGPHQAGVPRAALDLYYPIAYGDVVRENAARSRLPLHLVLGMIRQESAFDLGATSRAGASGLMQLMPATAEEVAGKLGMSWSRSRLGDPAYNLRLGTAYFRQVLGMFDGDVELALAGYNGGPYRIRRLWRETGSPDRDVFLEDLRIPESKTYVKRILLLADSYRQLYPAGEP